jgi:uncharacterized membrane protein
MSYNGFITPKASGSGRVNVGPSERIASAIAGGFLISTGILNIKKRPAIGIASALAGGSLLFRGSTGIVLFTMLLEEIHLNKYQQQLLLKKQLL